MMDYGLFKKVITERILDYLPPIFSDADVINEKISKINEEKDALIVRVKGMDNVYAVPTVYLDDAYKDFCKHEDLDDILLSIAYIIMQYTGHLPREIVEIDFSKMKDKIVMVLVNREKNVNLLKKVPYKEVMDLAVIYRMIMSADDTGFNSVLITNEILNEIDITLKELNEIAIENTNRMFPLEICKFSKEFYLITNESKIHGATAMIYPGALKCLADIIEDDFYLIPSSIHEILAVPLKYSEPDKLVKMLERGNSDFTEDSEILSNSIYYYNKEDEKLKKVASYNSK